MLSPAHSRLGVRCDRLACPFLVGGELLDVVADPEVVDRGDPGRAGLPGPLGRLCDLRVFGGEPASDLRQHGAVVVANLGRQCGGGVPAFEPFGPRTGGALDRGHPPAVRRRRRGAVAEGGRCPLDPVQSAEIPLGHVRVLPDPVERFGGQIVQHRAAVEQERLTQDRRDPGVDILLDLIAPATKHMRHLLLRVVDAIFAEHAPGQRQALETMLVVRGVCRGHSGRRRRRCWLRPPARSVRSMRSWWRSSSERSRRGSSSSCCRCSTSTACSCSCRRWVGRLTRSIRCIR
jgi:hypothetical protein